MIIIEMDNEADQIDEILALKSIYGEKSVVCDTEDKPYKGKLFIDVDASQCFSDGEFKLSLLNNPEATVALKHMTPLCLTFSMPPDYPSSSPPSFTLSALWLTQNQVEDLSAHLSDLWVESSVVLFIWWDFLQRQALSHLDITATIPLPQHKLVKLTEHNAMQEEKSFQNEVHNCPVCFCTKKGSQCCRLVNCAHVFCKGCMGDYLSVLIKEGSVASLACMLPQCHSDINPADVRSLVEKEIFARYDQLLLQTTLDQMSDVRYCPRPECRKAVIIDRTHNLGSCSHCTFSFCIHCQQTYHGVDKCKFQSGDMNMYKEYTQADEEGKLRMEEMYGKKKLEDMVSWCDSLKLISSSTVKCPKCSCCIEKIDGCNKMTCNKCNTLFCWLCGHKLDRNKPYDHFADKKLPCYNKLFFGMAGNNDDDDDDLEDDFQ